ncbi:MAG: hypothetical protein H0U66_13380 [Gemmatimonadaceae bacterium]|nr:hypothetical protein [Gemmatimonadaceae bacterium]
MISNCFAPGIRITRILLAFAQVALLASCGADVAAPTRVSQIVGNYRLRSINGSPLPIVVPQSPHAFVIDSALMELGDGGTYVEQMWGQSSSDITIGISAPKVNNLILFDQGAYGMSSDAEVAFASLVGFASVNYFGTATLSSMTTLAPPVTVDGLSGTVTLRWVREH